ncbi:hypothetical protein B0X78_00230 [bacterium AM6]|nr:hypothetical protein B0X78_00230 [bacterium AM6]
MEEEGDPVAEVKALIEARDRQPVGKIVAWQHCGENHEHMVISDSRKKALKEGETEKGIRKIDAAYSIPLVRQPVGEPVCSGGFVISNGSGEKYMAWGQVGPEWTADRSAALWLVRRADAEALAAENEDAWSILSVERCALPPSGWACTLASGHEVHARPSPPRPRRPWTWGSSESWPEKWTGSARSGRP